MNPRVIHRFLFFLQKNLRTCRDNIYQALDEGSHILALEIAKGPGANGIVEHCSLLSSA